MGICLDTDASVAQDTNENASETWKRNSVRIQSNHLESTTNQQSIDMDNSGKIKFDPPKVPVIFVLGGPGSGKVTHCDTFMQERRGVIHINMMDLLQQYAMGNDMQDFSQLSSKTVTEVLMLEMKMAPTAKAYLISGYPRSMRDVVEYSEKIQVVNGIILISWRQSVLQKQIDYGAKLGHVVLSLAKMELENFFKNVMPVADYFDQSDMLIAVNGERAPTEVYKDFRAAVLDILSTLENQEAILNGVTGMGRGLNDIPGSIVSVDTAPSQEKNITELGVQRTSVATANHTKEAIVERHRVQGVPAIPSVPQPAIGTLMGQNLSTANNHMPPIIWVIGGPGSNKASLCMKATNLNPGWNHISIGGLIRTITDAAPRANTESYAIKESLAAGELVPEKNLNELLDASIKENMNSKGIIIDGYPRNQQQVKHFENKYKLRPPMVLLDCSKLQLGRGRIDDTVASFRRRLEIFREQTLPMLKLLDNSNRLVIVDGDTESPSVQREFEKTVRNHIQRLSSDQNTNDLGKRPPTGTTMQTVTEQTDAILNGLENNVPGTVPTISHHVSMMNGHLKNNSNLSNVVGKTVMNGNAGRAMDFKNMLQEAERYPVDSYM